MIKKILVIYTLKTSWEHARHTHHQHLKSFQLFDSKPEVVYYNAFQGNESWWGMKDIPQEMPDFLASQSFDAVILHDTFLGYRCEKSFFYILKRHFEWISNMRCLKIAMPQDEYDHAHLLDDWLFDWGISIIFSNFNHKHRATLYPRMHKKTTFYECLTGYVHEATAEEYKFSISPYEKRKLDIVYRAKNLAYRFGSLGRLKAGIAEIVLNRARHFELVCDISTCAENTIFGSHWLDFLASSKATIGTPSGASAIDYRGEVRAREEIALQADSNLSFETFKEQMPPDWDQFQFAAIGPRHFEAIMMKTCQILVEGDYSGVLKPDQHYIALKADFSNLDEALLTLKNKQKVETIIEAAYDEIYLSGKYTYQQFARQVEQAILKAKKSSDFRIPNPEEKLSFSTPQKGPRKRIAMLSFSEITRDTRVRRTSDLLVRRGHDVRVYSFNFESNVSHEDYMGYNVRRLPIPHQMTLNVEGFRKAMGNDFCHLIDKMWPGLLVHSTEEQQKLIVAKIRGDDPQDSPKPSLYGLMTKPIKKVGNFSGLKPLVKPLAKQIYLGLQTLLASEVLIPAETKIENEMAETRQRFQMNLDTFKAVGDWATHVYVNDLEVLWAGVMLKKTYGTPLIYDAHELWPYLWIDGYRSAVFMGFYSAMERMLLKYTDGRIAVSDDAGKFLQHTYDSEPFHTVYSAPSIKMLCDEKLLMRSSKRRGILYHGWFKPYRGLEEVLDAVPQMQDCRVAFRGYGPPEYDFASIVKQRTGSSRVEILPKIHVDQLSQAASDFDIGLVPFLDSTMHLIYEVPNKFFEYMMGGLALFSSDLVGQRNLIEKHQMGVIVPDIRNPLQVAQTMNDLLRQPEKLDTMRRNAWKAARDIYHWETTCLDLIKVLERVGL